MVKHKFEILFISPEVAQSTEQKAWKSKDACSQTLSSKGTFPQGQSQLVDENEDIW